MNPVLRERFQIFRKRLQTAPVWAALPPLISAVLIILNIDVLSSLNPRHGQRAILSELPAEDPPGGGIRLTIHSDDEKVFIRTGTRQQFVYAKDDVLAGHVPELDAFLLDRTKDLARNAMLSLEYDPRFSYVTLAVDERLSYGLVKPIIRALAKAKLTKYGFEIRRPLLASAGEGAGQHQEGATTEEKHHGQEAH